MANLSKFLYNVSSGRIALASTAAFLLFMVFVLPGQAMKAAEYSGEAGSPDQSFFYTAADLYAMAEAYGADGRAAYIRARATFDVIFPIFYAVFLGTTISWAFGKAFAPGSRARLFNLFPILGLFFDYLENTGAVIVMSRYPELSPGIAAITPFLSMIKWFFVNGSFVVLAAGLVAAWLRRNRSIPKIAAEKARG